ncbi:sulfotransferase domain-containing protein [Mucisphaera sp.]|uniref:sulfotransferase domain-containing protein n=1 Tax=Mucisphaera sp. TaxID=2913024 RepID=UPI003D1420B7
MIVISGSLPKSGSTWLYSMTEAALVAGGYRPADRVRKRFRLEDVLVSKACEISYATPGKLLRLLPAHAVGEAVLCKTHFAPSRSLRALMKAGIAKGTYIYRDPRDSALSALDHGERARTQGYGHELGKLKSVAEALHYTHERSVREWAKWSASPGLLMLRYEDLLADPEAELRRVVNHLGLRLDDGVVAEIVRRFDRRNVAGQTRANLMVNKATTRRWMEEMTVADQRLAEDLFGRELEAMGYAA